jgi:hypothetical protein
MVNFGLKSTDIPNMKKIIATSLSLLTVIVLLAACSGDITKSPTVSDYRVEAMLTNDIGLDSAWIYVTLAKNGDEYFDADITIDSLPLDTAEGGYWAGFVGVQFPPGGAYILEISDNDTLIASISIELPAAFAIDGPDIREFDGGAEPVQWTASVGATGFILATRPPDSTIIFDAYETYVGINSASIPPDAFLHGVDKILGRHDIFVAAFAGVPMAVPGLPFDIPADSLLPDNYSASHVDGAYGGMVIPVPDSMFVIE